MAGNLKSQLFSGVFYTALAKYSGVVISLVVAGVLHACSRRTTSAL